MTVRLAFAVAVHVVPDVLIIDEALGVGDTAFQSKCLARIREMQRSGVAILLVSHAPNTIIEFCDRAAYLDRGRLVGVGDCREIVELYTNDFISSHGGTTLPSIPAEPADAFHRTTTPVTRASAPRKPQLPKPPTEIVSVVVVDETGVPKQAFSCGDVVSVRIEVAFHRDNPAPCYGIQIKSPDDIVLWTCTTQLMDIALPSQQAGTRAMHEWRLGAHFGGGRYVVAVGSGDRSSGAYLPHSRMHYAGHFDVLPEPRRGSGWLEPDVRFGTVVPSP